MTKQAEIMEARYGLPHTWVHEPYSTRWAHREGLFRIILGRLGPANDILDYGCGDGWYAARFVRAGFRVSGVDKSERAIGFASRIIPEGRFTTTDGTVIPFPDSSFDAVTCIQVLEHLTEEEIAAALGEFQRVLRPGGRLIVSVPSVNRPMSKAHLRHYAAASLKAALSAFGEVTNITGHEAKGAWPLRMKKLLDNRFWSLRGVSRFFYEKYYFSKLNDIHPESANNLVAVVRKKSRITDD
jgi:ubiquinone/menaquinone biosynthesis C-methylase UbiE